jgi:hypothetical protein
MNLVLYNSVKCKTPNKESLPRARRCESIIRAHESAIIQLIRRRVTFLSLFRHNIAENGPHDLKMVQKYASSNSTQSVIKIQPLRNKNMKKVTAIFLTKFNLVLNLVLGLEWSPHTDRRSHSTSHVRVGYLGGVPLMDEEGARSNGCTIGVWARVYGH